jgi:hypothetical protein
VPEREMDKEELEAVETRKISQLLLTTPPRRANPPANTPRQTYPDCPHIGIYAIHSL